MRVRSVNEDGSWQYGKGRNDYKSEIAAVAQNIKTRLLTFLGECFYSTNSGLDWFTLCGSKNFEQLSLVVSVCILNSENVTGINQLSFDVDNERNLLIQYDVATVFGDINEQVEFDDGVLNA